MAERRLEDTTTGRRHNVTQSQLRSTTVNTVNMIHTHRITARPSDRNCIDQMTLRAARTVDGDETTDDVMLVLLGKIAEVTLFPLSDGVCVEDVT